MLRVLFLIHDLGGGGAEKVLVNLVNRLDRDRFDVSVIALFGGGVNERYLAPHVHFSHVFPRPFPKNSKLMTLLSPRALHRLCVKETYDVEVAYLEGPSARVVAGCENPNTRLYCWIHSTMRDGKEARVGFRSHTEAVSCYARFDKIVAVSKGVGEAFLERFPEIGSYDVVRNTLDVEGIRALGGEHVDDERFRADGYKLVAIGKIEKNKGIDRLAHIVGRLHADGLPVCLYAIGEGSERAAVQEWVDKRDLHDSFVFLGYQNNPYKYLSRCDLLVCASLGEGYSTAVAEALVLGVPACTVDVAGMREMLGEHNEWGVVTENTEEALYEGMRELVGNPELLAHYRKKAQERGKRFSTEETVRAVEGLLECTL